MCVFQISLRYTCIIELPKKTRVWLAFARCFANKRECGGYFHSKAQLPTVVEQWVVPAITCVMDRRSRSWHPEAAHRRVIANACKQAITSYPFCCEDPLFSQQLLNFQPTGNVQDDRGGPQVMLEGYAPILSCDFDEIYILRSWIWMISCHVLVLL